jgi:hypothetical protein
VNPLDGFHVAGFVAALQADADHQVSSSWTLDGGQHAADAGGVGRDRLLHEDVLALATAYSNCCGRKPGGVAMTTRSQSGVDRLLVGVEAGECGRSGARRPCRRSGFFSLARRLLPPCFLRKASATATSLTLPLVFMMFDAAPVPRPPQPTKANLISSLPAACAPACKGTGDTVLDSRRQDLRRVEGEREPIAGGPVRGLISVFGVKVGEGELAARSCNGSQPQKHPLVGIRVIVVS